MDWENFTKQQPDGGSQPTGVRPEFQKMLDERMSGPTETAPGSDTYVEKKITPADPGRPVNEYENMPWSEVGSKALENAWPSAKGVVTDTASAIYNYDKTLPALAHTAAGLGRKAYRAVTGDESGANDPMAKEDMAAADALIGDYKDKYGSMPGFKKRLAEDPFNIGMDAASVVAPAAKVPGVTSKVARAAQVAMDPVDAAVTLGKKALVTGQDIKVPLKKEKVHIPAVPTAIADGGEFAQRLWMSIHSGKGMEPYKIIQDASKIPGPDGDRARATLTRFLQNKGDPKEIADAATNAFEEIQKRVSDDYRSTMADITQFQRPLSFKTMDTAYQDLDNYMKAGHPEASDARLAQEALDIVFDRYASPDPNMKNIDGFHRMKRDIRQRAKSIQDTNMRNQVYALANAAKKTISDVDPKYSQLMEKWEDWIDQARDFKATIGAGNQRMSESTFLNNLKKSLKNDRKGDLVKQLSQTQAGRDLPYMIAGDSLKDWLPDWWFGNLANIMPSALAYFTHGLTGSGIAAIPGAAVTSPRVGAHLTRATGAGRRWTSNAMDKASKVIDKANNPLVTQPLYQEGREERLGRRSGGRVGTIPHEAIADQLVAQADRAKKFLGKTTEALLDTPDEMVAKALAVASKGL